MTDQEKMRELFQAVQRQQTQIAELLWKLNNVNEKNPVQELLPIPAMPAPAPQPQKPKLSNPQGIICDPEDEERVLSRTWSFARTARTFQADFNGHTYTLGRFVLGFHPGDSVQVEHKNGNRKDARKENLIVKEAQRGPLKFRRNSNGTVKVVLKIDGKVRTATFDNEEDARGFIERLEPMVTR